MGRTGQRRRPRMRIVLAVTVLVSFAIAARAESPESIKADPEVQALLDRYRTTPRWTPEFYVQLTALHDLTKQKDPRPRLPRKPGPPVLEEQRHVIQQAAYYFAQGSSPPPREDPNGLVVNE